DLPELLSYKELILATEKPLCALERIRLDLSDANSRRLVFAQLNRRAKRIVVLTEGLLIYLTPEEVGVLARDIASGNSFEAWITDLSSPVLLRLMQRTAGKKLSEAGAPFRFGPAEGADFFAPYGWKPRDVRGMLKTAARFGRPPLLLRLLARLPERP